MTQRNDPTPPDDRNFVDDMILRRVIRGAQHNVSNIKTYVKCLERDEPRMVEMVQEFSEKLRGTINKIEDVFSSEDIPHDPEGTYREVMLLMFSLGFRTGEENMRKFYGEALGGLIKDPHDYNYEDFE